MDELAVTSSPVVIDQFELIITCPLTYRTRIKNRFRQVALGNVGTVSHPMSARYENHPIGRAPDRFHRYVGMELLTYRMLHADSTGDALVLVKNIMKEASVPLILDDFKKMMSLPECLMLEHHYGEVNGHISLMNGAENRAYEVEIQNAAGEKEGAIDRVTLMFDRTKYGFFAEAVLFNGSSLVEINHVAGRRKLEMAADEICILLSNTKKFVMQVVGGPMLAEGIDEGDIRVETEKMKRLERRMTTK